MAVQDPIRQARRADADYARLAPVYDEATRWIDLARAAAVDRLAPQPGETVADIACGTGFCLPALVQAVGPAGTVIGVEPSRAMLAHARSRTVTYANVLLVESRAQNARLAAAPDALLFSFAHDVLQSRAALEGILAQAKPGARVVAVGAKFFPWCLAPRNIWFLAGERGYVTNYRGFWRPWRYLAAYLDEFEVQSLSPGNKYLAIGRVRTTLKSARGKV
ncbi:MULTISPECIES: class I SAM-dependent methyltransferase [unclassified Bradyrhizobium]|uniref:class I SAM-dependent methyltransferase n=1 Tax=unclassified Bradyrhizobium TaxID=2631580 RepID=UPI001BA66780|nr:MULTISPECIES: class I SAM-dependent methyltransferase [unclassified Bradyrhizobium]MBR1208109.1 methyltransferase domain-containing protein [Bradyrhizobium sp. AUGA SZCCT0124]MBR1316482.1 methyltransferase domain-containing protein [Bradyrhizobium sp. AUGA SZCCT0051]MBR1344623.1 methyltransferase domain-containing protein [Bradyrhizobium sp. AUGA SZCCT0105]MBR1359503.1 methyltransferase domain-containing protein [Bradyrhizobium sp. AUGA SZCCT0045]